MKNKRPQKKKNPQNNRTRPSEEEFEDSNQNSRNNFQPNNYDYGFWPYGSTPESRL